MTTTIVSVHGVLCKRMHSMCIAAHKHNEKNIYGVCDSQIVTSKILLRRKHGKITKRSFKSLRALACERY